MATPAHNKTEGEAPKPAIKGRGLVKSVLSGDSIVIMDDKPSAQGPPAEKIISLASLSAPKLARGKDEVDEPFAFESREFVRKLVVGKRIFFAVEYTTPNGRDFCTVFLPGTGSEPGENLNNLLVSEGWATLYKSQVSGKKGAEAKEALAQLEEAAKEAGKGQHAKGKSGTPRPAEVDSDELYKQLKGKTLNAVVEQVRTGSSIKVTVLPTRHTFQVLLSGVQCPGWRKKEGEPASADPAPEPFAREAKYFVEQHVLQRDVNVTIEGIAASPNPADKSTALSGSIEFKGHDVAEELLKAGLGKYVAYSAAPRGAAWVQKLKAADKFAKEKKLRLYANYVEPKSEGNAKLLKEFTGKVVSVDNTGTLKVLPEGSSTEVQVNLSSIKVPRPPFPGEKEPKDDKEKAERIWAAEGKEMMRKRLIGNKVRVVYDYTRKEHKVQGENEKERTLPEKAFYTVYQNETNLAVLLVEAGLANPLPGRAGEERSMDFEVLLMAEKKAAEAKKGLHGKPEKAPVRRINDLCVDPNDEKLRANQITRAKQFVPSFSRMGQMKAVVEHVFSGARFKISVPKETTVFMFALSGIRVPRRGEGADSDELSNQALLFSREKLHQYEVTIEVENIDKGGNFVGNLFVGQNIKKNFATMLVENGLASVHYASAEHLREYKELVEAEEAAKKKKAGVWKNWDEEAEKAKQAAFASERAEASGKGAPQEVEVMVTEVTDGARFYVQIVGAETAGLDELVSSLTELSVSEGGGLPLVSATNGMLVRGQFSADDRWYRAKVLEVNNNKGEVKLQYIDYGNSEWVPAVRVRQLPPSFNALPAQAQPAALAYVKPLNPENEDAGEARNLLKDLTADRKLKGTVEYKDQGVLMLNLHDPVDGYSVTSEMLRNGLARLAKRRYKNPTYEALREEEAKAKKKHVGIWYLGDIPDSDEDEGPSIRPPKGAAAKEAPKKK